VSIARRCIKLILLCSLAAGCTHPSIRRQAESSFLPEESNGHLIRDIPFSPAPSSTGLKPVAISLIRYWDLRREARTVWLDYIHNHSRSELLAEFGLIEQQLAKEGIWIFNAPMSEEQLKERIDAGVPVMVFQAPAPLAPKQVSIRLLAGYRDETPAYFLYDGTSGPLVQTQQDFLEQHRNTLRYAMLFCPASSATWKLSPAERSSMAQYYEWREEWTQAVRQWSQLVSLQKNHSAGWVRLGNAHVHLQQESKAMQSYRQAIVADPSNGAAYNNLAFLLVESNPAEALGNTEKVGRQRLSATTERSCTKIY